MAQDSRPQAVEPHPAVRGIMVESVRPNNEGSKAGLISGDILQRWLRENSNGGFNSPFDLSYLELSEGSRGRVQIEGLRDGKRHTWFLGNNGWGIRVRPILADSFLSLYLQGQTAMQHGNAKEAIRIWQALAATQKPDNPLVILWLHTRIADEFVDLQEWEKAGEVYGTAIGMTQGSEPQVRAELFQRWGRILESRDDLISAEKCYREMLVERQKQNPDSMAVASALLNIGVINLRQGNLPAAEDNLRHALDFEQKLAPQSVLTAATLQSLGVLFQENGKLAKAESYYRRALAIDVSAHPRTYNHEIALINIGTIESQRGNAAMAESYFRKALSIAQALQPESIDVAKITSDLSHCLLARNEASRAEEYASKALAIRQRLSPGSLVVVSSLLDLGKISKARGDLNKSEEFYRHALAIAESLPPPHPELATVFNALAGVLKERGNFAEAETYYRKALSMLETMAPESAAHASAIVQLANVLQEEHREQLAVQLYSQAVAEFERLISDLGGAEEDVVRYRAQLQDFYRKYLALLVSLGEVELAFKVSEASHARALAEMLNAGHFDIRSSVDSQLLDLERSVHSEIRTKSEARVHLLAEQKDTEAKRIEQELQSLIARHQEIQGEINSSSPGYLQLTRPQALDTKDVQGLLDPDTVLLEYSIGAEHSYVWSISQGALKVYELPKSDRIEAVARRLYRTLTVRIHRRQPDAQVDTPNSAKSAAISQRLASELSRMLLSPLVNDIKGKRLAIVSDGVLHYVPFAALPSPERPAVPLIVEHEIVNLPSASVLAEIRRANQPRPQPHKEVAVLADPVFDTRDDRVQGLTKPSVAGFRGMSQSGPQMNRSASDIGLMRNGHFHLDRLLYTRDEAKAILALVPKERVFLALDFLANRATATDPKLADYRIVHFATHGFLDSKRPELSGLVLSLVNRAGKPQDGFLGLEDVYNLKLPVDLVVLSGCQTGLGEEIRGEGLIGLTRGFIYAGANRVVASLWSVDDFVTSELMTRFYRAMEVEKLRPAAALRKAQTEIWKHAGWRSPYYWAAFQIQGEWR